MQLIEKLDKFHVWQNGRSERIGKFYCPICKQYVEKPISNGRKTVSCGSKECTPSRSFRHGYTGTQVYNSWAGMVQRCANPKSAAFKYYGAKGITIPEKWKTFEGFLEDMGESFDVNMSIDRIDNTKSYSKENCQWLSVSKNCEKDKVKEIAKLDSEGNVIITYPSAKEAAIAEGIKFPSAITRVARGERKAYKGVVWRYT